MKKRFFKNSFNLISSKLRPEKGFMLAEVLIVVAIIIVFTSVIMINHKEGQKRVLLERAAHKLAQDIRVAEEMTLSGRECPECGGVDSESYGIYFEIDTPEQYIIYADKNGNEVYNPPPDDADIEIIALEKGVFIKNIDPNPSKISINFLPPDPTILMKWQGGDTNLTTIEIALKSDETKIRRIKINTAGLIEIE